jgi:phage terminase Nu1 subunit (DNA packaging protein)
MAGSSTRESIAAILRVTVRNTFYLEKRGMPRLADGTFDPDAVLEWYQEYKSGGMKASSLVEADTRLRLAQAGIQELKLAQAEGKSFPAHIVCSAWEKAVASCRSKLLSIPGKLAPQIVSCNSTADVKDVLERDIYESLDELAIADYSGIVEGDEDGDLRGNEPLEVPAKAHRKRVGRSVSKAKPRRQRRTGAVVHKPG